MICRQSSVLLVHLLAVPCFADAALDHLTRAAKMYSRLKSFQVEAVTETTMKYSDNRSARVKIPVILYFVPPKKIRIETKDAHNIVQTLLISDGVRVTEYHAWTNTYMRMPDASMKVLFSPERGTGMGEMLYGTIADRVTKATVTGREILQIGSDRIACAIIDVEYGQDRDLPKYSFWIAENTGLVMKRAVTFWRDGERKNIVCSIQALTLDEPVPDNVFEFWPPPTAREVPAK